MWKAIKWISIALGILLLLLVLIVGIYLWKHQRFGFYASGGPLSENQAKYDVTYYDLHLLVNSRERTLAGFTDVVVRSLVDGLDRLELDLIDNFKVRRVSNQDSATLSFKHDDDKLWVDLLEPARKNQIVALRVFYRGKPPVAIRPPWIGGVNWSKDSRGNDWIGLSCQSEGAKIWFPCKDHPSDKPDSAGIHITVPVPYFCASNGLLEKVDTTANGWLTYHWKTRYPINNYNINFSIGIYEKVERPHVTLQGDTMPVVFYYLPEHREKADFHIDMAVDMLKTYRKFYGEYPFWKEKFGLVEVDYLGMEHQTINAYGNKFRYTTIAGQKFDWLMLHEMGHEWWGNKVSVKDWADFWIHEGICTYGEALFRLAKFGEEQYHRKMRSIMKGVQNRSPMIPKRNATSQEAYQGDIYYKGAALMHSLRFWLGDSLFFDRLWHFANDSAYTYRNLVTTDDFLKLFCAGQDSDLVNYLEMFLYTTRLPEVRVDSLGEKTYRLSVPNIDFRMPLEVELGNRIDTLRLGPEPVVVEADSFPRVDPRHWYLIREGKRHPKGRAAF